MFSQDPKHIWGHSEQSAFRRVFARFIRRKSGATAVEFALVAPFFLVTIMFLASIGYMVIMKQCLDFATAKAARMIRTGQVQAAGITTSSAFVTQALCPSLPSLFNCSNVIVSTQTYPTNVWVWWSYPYTVYSGNINSSNNGLNLPNLSTSNTFCPGSASMYVYLQVVYPVSFFMSMLSSSTIATTYNGQQYYMVMSTAVFLNEPFLATGNC